MQVLVRSDMYVSVPCLWLLGCLISTNNRRSRWAVTAGAASELIALQPRSAQEILALNEGLGLKSCTETEASNPQEITAWRNLRAEFVLAGQLLVIRTSDKDVAGDADGTYTMTWGGAKGQDFLLWHMRTPSRVSRLYLDATVHLAAAVHCHLAPSKFLRALTTLALRLLEDDVGVESSHGVPLQSRNILGMLEESITRTVGFAAPANWCHTPRLSAPKRHRFTARRHHGSTALAPRTAGKRREGHTNTWGGSALPPVASSSSRADVGEQGCGREQSVHNGDADRMAQRWREHLRRGSGRAASRHTRFRRRSKYHSDEDPTQTAKRTAGRLRDGRALSAGEGARSHHMVVTSTSEASALEEVHSRHTKRRRTAGVVASSFSSH